MPGVPGGRASSRSSTANDGFDQTFLKYNNNNVCLFPSFRLPQYAQDDAKAVSTSSDAVAGAGPSLPAVKTTPAGAVDSSGSLYDMQLDTPKAAAGSDESSKKKATSTTTTTTTKKMKKDEGDDTSAAAEGDLNTVQIDSELLDGMMEAVELVTAVSAASSAPPSPAAAAAAVEEADVELVLDQNEEEVKVKEKVEEKVEEQEKEQEEEMAAADEENQDAGAESDDSDPFPEKTMKEKESELKEKVKESELKEKESEPKEKEEAKVSPKPEEKVKREGEAKVDPEPDKKEPEKKKVEVNGGEEKEKGGKDEDEEGAEDVKSESSGYESSAYSDGEDAATAAAAEGDNSERVVVAATNTSPQTSTKDANRSEVQGRAKDSPPPTPRIRGTPSSSPQLSPHLSSGNNGMGGGGVANPTANSRLGGTTGSSSPTEASGWTSVVVLYTTSMSTVRKTAGQCQRVKQTLANLGVEFLERDISMAVAYKEELKKRLSLPEDKPAPVPVPYLFIDDEKIGGGDDLDDMAAEGYLKELLLEKGRTSKRAATSACAGCGGKRLVICQKCHGSMRLVMRDQQRGAEVERRCPWCNEVGMSECEMCVPKFARTAGKA